MPDTFKPGDLVRWIGEWPYPLVAAPPRDNTVLSIEADGRVRLEGRYDGEGPQRWSCLPEQLVHREPPAPTTAPAAVDPDKWGPWQNLPCPDDPFGLLCRVYFDEGNADVGAASYYGLEVSWGTDGLPVFNLPPTAGETA